MTTPRIQVTIAEMLLATALIASIVAAITTSEPVSAFATASALRAFIWHRPMLSRLWAIGMLGLGAGLFAAGCSGRDYRDLPTIAMLEWGAGMVVGSAGYMVVFHWRGVR